MLRLLNYWHELVLGWRKGLSALYNAKQKYLGCKKMRGQSEATMVI